MLKDAARKQKGLYNSSHTRVYPLFLQLIARDPTGRSWLPTFLDLIQENVPDSLPLPQPIGLLLPDIVAKRRIGPGDLKNHGIEALYLPACFEKLIPPSTRFLRWLIEHPENLYWPKGGKAPFSHGAQNKREDLMGRHGKERQVSAQQAALTELEQKGAAFAHGKWWSFEGSSHVDCYFETEHVVLLIEGKRTESLSNSVNWYPGRNQLVRNLEVAKEIAGEKHFAVVVIAENEIGALSQEVIDTSLPHFSPKERTDLMRHYLGCLTWKEVCVAVNVPYESLPDTAPDWIASL